MSAPAAPRVFPLATRSLLSATFPMNPRKKLIAGNWKMNKAPADGAALVAEIVTAVGKITDVVENDVTWFQVRPESVLFQMPDLREPYISVVGFCGSTARRSP